MARASCRKEGRDGVNIRIRHLAMAFIVLYAVLFLQVNRWQFLQRDSLVDDPRNNRVTVRQFNSPRGRIVTADGDVVARTVKIDPKKRPNARFQYQREYPEGDLFANITGYYTVAFGATQLERTENDVLTGKTGQQQVQGVDELFTRDLTGTVELTLRTDLQKVAQQALKGRVGSAVVMDPRTGAVLAMYSNPTFDPNQVARHDTGEANDVLMELQADKEKPLLANAYQERYMPGSTFKVLTTAIGLETGALTNLSNYPVTNKWVPPNTDNPIQNYGKKTCGGDLAEVFSRSCNIPFAQTAVALGPDTMVNGVNAFGLEEAVPIDLPGAATSTFGGGVDYFKDSLALLAIHGFGQGGVQLTPLHMAMIASSVANGGVMMKPYVVQRRVASNNTVISDTQAQPWKTPMTAATARTLTSLMEGVVREGTAACCMQLKNGVKAAAKTGTAQLFDDPKKQRSHAWIMGFAPAEQPRVAVAVMLKGVNEEISAGTGGKLAGPVAKRLLDSALSLVPSG